VLEKNAPTSMPLYVTNLTDIDIHYRKLTPGGMAPETTSINPLIVPGTPPMRRRRRSVTSWEASPA
jgi:hypothetical protein